MHPWDREAAARVLHPYGGSDEVPLLLANLGMLDGIFGGQQLPCDAPHQGHHALTVEESTPAHHRHHPLRHRSAQHRAYRQAYGHTPRGKERWAGEQMIQDDAAIRK